MQINVKENYCNLMSKRIEHVLDVLDEIWNNYSYGANIPELRKRAFDTITIRNQLQSPRTIPDTCCRQMNLTTEEFDALVKSWLSDNSLDLQKIVLEHAGSKEDRIDISNFFSERENRRIRLEGEYRERHSLRKPKQDKIILPSENDEEVFQEGKEVYRLHKEKERNPKIVESAKRERLQHDKNLHCDICGFSFFEVYGEQGKGFIEAHHTRPLSTLKGEVETKITDIALVCSNCHTMLHRYRPWPSIKELRQILITQ